MNPSTAKNCIETAIKIVASLPTEGKPRAYLTDLSNITEYLEKAIALIEGSVKKLT